jgi:hypothetical protein
MIQPMNEWSSPPPAVSPVRYLVIAGAAALVMVLGSLGGYYASAPPSEPKRIEYRSVRLVPPSAATAPAEPVARPRPTILVPIAPPGAATDPAAPAEPAVAAAPQPPPAEPVAAAAPAEPAVAAAPAQPVAPAEPAAEGPREAAPKDVAVKSDRKVPSLLAHEPLPDGSTRGEEEAAAATRRALESRLRGGRATSEELRMLKAICQHQGDAACKERAQEALRKLSE